ncbi:MAG: response regulator [Acidobacteria bacterium]|nr:response regulator [Acidobacteriota bacterium]
MRERVLVVDDEQVVLDAVTRALRKTDLRIDTARGAKEALALLSASSHDLVITDLMMPEMDGLAFLRHIREAGLKTAAIMITGYPTIQTALRAKRLGAFEYVTKPFTRQELHSVVVRAIRAAAAEPMVPADPAVPRYYLPGHAWVEVEPEGTVRMGMALAFTVTVGRIASIRLPAPGATLEQGRVCATLLAADGVEHSLHAPLSGTVVEVNPAVREDPSMAGWLMRLVPRRLNAELPDLSPLF